VEGLRRGRGVRSRDCYEREHVGVETEASDDARRDPRDDARVPKLLTRVRVGDVHLDERHSRFRHEGRSVAERVAVVGERRGIEDDGSRGVDGLVEPSDEGGFVIRLPHLDRDSRWRFGDEESLESRKVLVAIDVGLATTEPAEVGSVEDENTAHGSRAYLTRDDARAS
jgi:hypothetical protein